MIRAYKGMRPTLGPRALVDVSAQVIGDVELGEDASVWMNTVVRGDVNRIRIGARTNVQDNCVLHVTAQHPTTLAEDVTVGPLRHPARLHHRAALPRRHRGDRPQRGRGGGGVDRRRRRPRARGDGGALPQRRDGLAGEGPAGGERGGAGRPAPVRRELRGPQGRLPVGGGGVGGDPGRPRHPRHPPRRDRGLARDRGRRAGALRPLRLPRDPHADLRGDGALRPRHRGRDRHRREGDVHVRRPGRRLAHPAARGHGRGRARRDRAQPDEQRPRAEGLRDGADVPPRAAAEGPLPAVPPGGRGGLRLHQPHDRRRGDRAGPRLPRRLRRERARARPQLGG